MEYVFWYKLSCLLVGLIIIYLGYQLFLKGVFNESGDVQGSFKDYKLVVKKAAPGTYFALFGSLVIALTVFKGFSTEELSKGGVTAAEKKLSAPIIDTNFITIKDSTKKQ